MQTDEMAFKPFLNMCCGSQVQAMFTGMRLGIVDSEPSKQFIGDKTSHWTPVGDCTKNSLLSNVYVKESKLFPPQTNQIDVSRTDNSGVPNFQRSVLS